MRRKEIPTRLKINVTNRRALELGALEYLRRSLQSGRADLGVSGDDVRLALRGLSHRMEVEVETGIPLAAHTVADLRARNTWPPGLQLIVPDEPDHPASAVRVERRK